MLLCLAAPAAAEPPGTGQRAPDFSLRRLQGGTVQLSQAVSQGTVVLIVLRGYPGYQCPVCNRQAQDFLANAKGFQEASARVILVYPGAAEGLQMQADEFARDKPFPPGFDLLLDPGYRFTNLYDLRWDAPNETAYPSTFIIDQLGVIVFAKISREHGGRTTAAEVLEALRSLVR